MRRILAPLVAASLAACSADAYSPAVADHIEVVQGAAQRGTLGAPLDTIILASVVDVNGDPVPGIEVTWQVLGGGGAVEIASGEIPGTLSAAAWTLGLGFDRQRLLLTALGVEPVTVEADARVFTATQFAVGGEFGCALDEDAATWCWGLLPGSGSAFENTRIPSRVDGAPPFVKLVVGDNHICGLTAGGEVWCWGMNFFGQLGNGITSPWPTGSPVPLKVNGLPPITSLDAGDQGTCALEAGGSLWCWGRVADGAVTTTATAQFTGTVFEQIALSTGFACGVVTGGEVACWGRNNSGQLGRGTVGGSSATLLPIASSFVATALDAGNNGACAISSGRDVICWGSVNGIRGRAFGAPSLGVPSRSDEDSPALRLSLGYYCGAIWQSPTSPRLLCPGSWYTDIETLPTITGVSFSSIGDLCLAVGTGALYCKTYSDQAFGPPFDFHGTGVPAPDEDAP